MLTALSNTVPDLNREESVENFRTQPDICLQNTTVNFFESNFEVANRAFYATINKFTRQAYNENKRTSYSFLENWHLHSIYSKSQQMLLGIHPIKPSVLLSGDDFMFTPPFVQQQDDDDINYYYHEEEDAILVDEEEEDEYDGPTSNEFYSLIPCPNNHKSTDKNNFILHNNTTTTCDEMIVDNHNDYPTLYKKSNNMFMAASYPSPTAPSTTLYEAAFSPSNSNHENEAFPIFGDHNNPYWLENKHQHHVANEYHKLNQSSPMLPVNIPSSHHQLATVDAPLTNYLEPEEDLLEEPELSPCSSYDDDYDVHESVDSTSSSDSSIYSYDFEEEQHHEVNKIQQCLSSTRSKSLTSDDTSSIVSYQSLEDLMENESIESNKDSRPSLISSTLQSELLDTIDSHCTNSNYGAMTSSIPNRDTVAIDIPGQLVPMKSDEDAFSLWTQLFMYVACFWKMLMKVLMVIFGSKRSAERQPLL